MLENQSLKIWGYAALGILGGGLIALVPLAIASHGAGHPHVGPAVVVVATISAAAAMAWALVFATLSFRSADEFLQQGSKVAWYWGGSIGLAATLPAYVFIGFGGLHMLAPSIPVRADLGWAFALGYGLPVVAQLIGFLVVAGWWRLAKR